jgi:hypothetical protein
MKPKLINLTPHDVIIQLSEASTITISPTQPMARVEMTTEVIGHIDGIPLVVPTYGETFNLPDPEVGTFLIVSNIVLAAHRNRFDLVTPSRPIRDASGKVIACGALSVVNPTYDRCVEDGTESHARALFTMKQANQQ